MKLLVFAFLTILTSFFSQQVVDTGKTHVMDIYVKTPSGSPVNYAQVGYAVCQSLTCLGGRNDFRTNKEGYVRLEWTTDCKICTIYINGKANEGKFAEGSSYAFTAK